MTDLWSLVVLTPEDRVHPITHEYGPQTMLFRTHDGLMRTLRTVYDPLNHCPSDVDICDWLESMCDYDIRITEHMDVELNP